MATSQRRDPNMTKAEEKQVLAWATKVRLDVIHCRQFGHTWTRGLDQLFTIDGYYVRQVECGRCGMVRRDLMPQGEYGYARRNYVAPPDYRREASDDTGSTRVPRWAIAEATTKRADVLSPPQDIVDWYYRRDGQR